MIENHKEILDSVPGKCIEEKVAKITGIMVSEYYKATMQNMCHEGGNSLFIRNDKFGLLITVTNTPKHKVINIKEILVYEEYRGKGLGTGIMKTIIQVANDFDCVVGLWCSKDNKKAYEFYEQLGFKHIETLDDYWLEINNKEI